MGHLIELMAKDGHGFSAYRADSVGTPRGAVVVLQEIWGVNDHIRKVADSYAADGYVAIAPAIFDRVEPCLSCAHSVWTRWTADDHRRSGNARQWKMGK